MPNFNQNYLFSSRLKMPLSCLCTGWPVNTAWDASSVGRWIALTFWSDKLVIAAGVAQPSQAPALPPLPSRLHCFRGCARQPRAERCAICPGTGKHTGKSKNPWESKTQAMGAESSWWADCPPPHTRTYSFNHLCNCLKDRKGYLVACTDAFCWFCSSSRWGLKPWHPEQLMSDVGREKNNRVKDNREKEKEREKSKGRGPGRREGAWELMRCEMTPACVVYSACEIHNGSPSSLSPFPSLARGWHSMSSCTKCPEQLT